MTHSSFRTDSLGRLKRLFSTLPSPPDSIREGRYRGEFIGPWWLRGPAPAFVAMTGLPGWKGKKFLNKDLAANIIVRNGVEGEGPRMRWVRCKSLLDGKESVGLRYEPDAPVPWRWIIDELRLVDARTILGMSVVDAPGLSSVGFPFLLVHED